MELEDAPTWDARFDLLDREIGSRISMATRPSSEVLCTWKRIIDSDGLVTIRSLVEETGWSQKHLISQFREHIGLAPKMFARVIRFGRAVDRLRQRSHASLTDLALDCGYYDQSHFDRDFRAFAGVTPTELLSTLGSHGGFSSGGKFRPRPAWWPCRYARVMKPTIFPFLRYTDAPAAMDWLGRAFLFEKQVAFPGPDGTIVHAELRHGSGVIGLSSATPPMESNPWSSVRQGVYVTIDDVNAHHERAQSAGRAHRDIAA